MQTLTYDFDQVYDRRASDSGKWNHYGDDVIPLWVADMDFRSPQAILDALHARVDHGIFGYGGEAQRLREAVCVRLEQRYGWQVEPEAIVLLPGLVSGLNAVTRAIGEPGDGVLVNTPVYPPFLTAPGNQGRTLQSADQRMVVRDGHLRFEVDIDALDAAVDARTRLFILCNPHNPTGRAFTRAELSELAALCARHDLVICSDEIHCELLLDDTRHIPIASLDPAVQARTITLLAPSKTFNVPGLGCSLAVVPDRALRARLERGMAGIVPHVNALGVSAALAAYTGCDDWLAALLGYLAANRDFVVDFIDRELPGIRTTVPEATYLAWLDCRELPIETTPYEFFLNEAKVAFNDGARFGQAGEGFVRLNFGCPRSTLAEGLVRVRDALVGG